MTTLVVPADRNLALRSAVKAATRNSVSFAEEKGTHASVPKKNRKMTHRHNAIRVVEVHTTDLAKSAETGLAASATKEFVGGAQEVMKMKTNPNHNAKCVAKAQKTCLVRSARSESADIVGLEFVFATPDITKV